MIRKTNGSAEWLEFELLSNEAGISHGVFLRNSEIPFQQIASTNQVHGCDVLHAMGQKMPDCDGMVTEVRDLALLIRHADCQAAIFYDPIEKTIANVHCGWRGNVQNIYAKTVEKMKGLFGSKPENLLVCISPSLGPEHSEFIHYKQELPEAFWQFQIRPLYFDLWAIARMQIEECGVMPSHVEIASICTYENPDDFFSYRRDKIKGRSNCTVAQLS